MRLSLILIFACIFSKISRAQVQSLDVAGPGGTSTYGYVRFDDPTAVGKKHVENVDYSDISGSPYWNDNWNAALLVLSSNKAIKLQNVKLNLYSNELLYQDAAGAMLAAENSIVKKLILFKGQDTTRVIAVFICLPNAENMANYDYYRVWNEGKVSLLQLPKVIVNTSEYEPLQGKSDHSFQTKSTYYILKNDKLNLLRGLNKVSILSVTGTPQTEIWLTNNDNRLKSENDIVAYFLYLNTLSK